jgi:plasmid stabilization system protein ParE
MKRAVIRRPQAELDLFEQFVYIGVRNLNAALRFLASAEATFDFLASMPGVGRLVKQAPKELQPLRKWRVRGFPNYLIYYHPRPDAIEIVRVLHGAREQSSALREGAS